MFAHLATASGAADWVRMPSHWPSQVDLLRWTQEMPGELTTILVIAGIVYLLWGYYLFKGLIVLNAAAVGGVIGTLIGSRTGAVLPAAILGAFVFGAAALCLMKWTVAVMGGLYGALIGASLWRSFDLDANFIWSGAAIGLVACGLLCFILFRGCVMMYTSMQGAAMLFFGLLSLVFKYRDSVPKITSALAVRPFFVPMILFIATVVGMLYQQNSLKPKPAAPVKK